LKNVFTTDQVVELTRRHNALIDSLRAIDVSQYVITDTDNIFYLTGATFDGMERPFFLLIDVNGKRTLVIPLLEIDHLQKAWGVNLDDVITYREFPAPDGQGWLETLLDRKLLIQGFAFEDSAPFSIARFLLEAGGDARDILSDLRMVKSEWEIRQIEHAAHYADLGVAKVLRNAYEGATAAETFLPTQKLMRSIIRETPSWDALATKVICAAWPAPISAEPHCVPDLGMRLRGGPHVAMVLTRVNGYAAECERTFFTAPPTQTQREMFEHMERARAVAFAMIRPGVPGAAIDEEVNNFLRHKGFGDFRTRLHRCGHGFGLGNHEPPWIAEGSHHVLEKNMLISIEPGIYCPGIGGYRHSDTVLVTETGYSCLTRTPTSLEALTRPRPGIRNIVTGWAVKRTLGL
jgi:Xaa-Pro dipeptidase